MTLIAYAREVRAREQISDNDRVWFPRWLRRYALSFPKGLTGELLVNRHGVVRVSQGLRDNGAPAWQRWQVVRAICLYRDVVLQAD